MSSQMRYPTRNSAWLARWWCGDRIDHAVMRCQALIIALGIAPAYACTPIVSPQDVAETALHVYEGYVTGRRSQQIEAAVLAGARPPFFYEWPETIYRVAVARTLKGKAVDVVEVAVGCDPYRPAMYEDRVLVAVYEQDWARFVPPGVEKSKALLTLERAADRKR